MASICHPVSALVHSMGAVAVLALSGCTADGVEAPDSRGSAIGNGALSGARYDLNIIGVPHDRSAAMDGQSGRRIFVKEEGGTKIFLNEGDFQVLDANGTDGTVRFSLPARAPGGASMSSYSVFARVLDCPRGSSSTMTCATDLDTGALWCSIEQMLVLQMTGASTSTNVSSELLTVCGDFDDDDHKECVPLFDDSLVAYFWSYDDNGMKLAQMRIYNTSSDFSAP